MNCEQVQAVLGPFHDGELGSLDRAAVEVHLGNCASCAAELAAIAELTEMVRALPEPEPSIDLWTPVARRLKAELPRRSLAAWKAARTWKLAAVAALALLAVATGWFVYSAALRSRNPSSIARDSADQEDPLLDNLLAARAGEPVSLQDAVRHVDFRVLATNDLPDGFCLDECCLCKEGCCPLVRCKFLRQGEQVLLVQCNPDHPVRYGNRPFLDTRINGKAARVVQCEDCLACSWQCQGTSLTLIGTRDLTQLVRLVAHVDQRLESKP